MELVVLVLVHGQGEQQNQTGSNQQASTKSSNMTISTVEPSAILTRDKNKVDWQYVQSKLEEINNSWSIITIDLKSANVNNDDILAFNTNMDSALKYTKAQDKANSLISVANIYSLLPKYEAGYTQDNSKIEMSYAKSDIVSSYALLGTNKWDNILSLVNNADTRISGQINMTNDKDTSHLKKIYVLLKDYIKSVNDKDTDLCYMKYYYLIEEMSNEN